MEIAKGKKLCLKYHFAHEFLTTGLYSTTGDGGLQEVLGPEEKGVLRPKMDKTLFSRWIWMGGAPKRVSFCGFHGILGGKHRRQRKLGRNLLD